MRAWGNLLIFYRIVWNCGANGSFQENLCDECPEKERNPLEVLVKVLKYCFPSACHSEP